VDADSIGLVVDERLALPHPAEVGPDRTWHHLADKELGTPSADAGVVVAIRSEIAKHHRSFAAGLLPRIILLICFGLIDQRDFSPDGAVLELIREHDLLLGAASLERRRELGLSINVPRVVQHGVA